EKVGALVAPTISVGMAQHHLAFPGSVTLKPTTLIAVVRDTVMSLARHGFTRFFFVNGHGGNIATVTAAFSEIYAERSMEKLSNQPSLKCALRNWWDGAGIRQLPSTASAFTTPLSRKWRATMRSGWCGNLCWGRATARGVNSALKWRVISCSSGPRASRSLMNHDRTTGVARPSNSIPSRLAAS